MASGDTVDMSAYELGACLRLVREAESIPALLLLQAEITDRWAGDGATPRLVGVINAKLSRLIELN